MPESLTSRLWPGFGRDLLLNKLAGSILIPRPFRWRVLRMYGLDLQSCRVSPGVWFGNRNVSIGAGTFVNYECMFNSSAPIAIGRNCAIGMRVTFVTSSHEVGPPDQRASTPTAEPISVGDGVWIGAGVTVLPGVTIGDGCLIAAGAVVSRDCEPHGVYAGVPARRVKELEPASV